MQTGDGVGGGRATRVRGGGYDVWVAFDPGLRDLAS